MRPLLILLAFLAALIASPAAAACGAAAGKTYSGNAAWDGGGTYNIELTLKPDCTLTYAIFMGRTVEGTWSQAGNRVTFDLPTLDIHYDGVLTGPVFEGSMTTQGSKGAFKFTAQAAQTTAAPAASKVPYQPRCGAPGQGGIVDGRSFRGHLKFDYRGLTGLDVGFNNDCTLTRRPTSGPPETGGRWSQKGDEVTFDFGKGVTFTGRVNRVTLTGDLQSGADHGTFNVRQGGYGLSDRMCGGGHAPTPDPAGHVYDGPVQYAGGKRFAMAVRFNLDCSVTLSWDNRDDRSGSWRQKTGGLVSFTTGPDGATYSGTLTDAGFSGTMDNGGGSAGTFTFKQRD